MHKCPENTDSGLDPRLLQIAALSALLVWGMTRLGFDVSPARVALTLGSALAVQLACTRLWRLPRFDPRSALISALSLCLLLRTDSAGVALLAAAIAISSKFLLRIGGKHVFNPTNLALVGVLLLTDGAWASPGQWGSTALGAFFAVCLGAVVTRRAARDDVTWAFLAFHALLLFGRSWRLGEPLAIPLHRLESGGLLLFAFFMISDPKTTPDSRAGRVLWALLVALGAHFVTFRLFRPNGLLWSLAALAPLVPLIDRLLPGRRYAWPTSLKLFRIHRLRKEHSMRPKLARSFVLAGALALATLASVGEAAAFCGFYVSRADAKIFNRASQVVLVRDGDRTVLTMAADFKGEPREFAVVVPVPTFIERGQIHVADKTLVDRLDGFTAPRLVEYFDEDPCWMAKARRERSDLAAAPAEMAQQASAARAKSLGVRIEAQYTVGEYDILILSAEQSSGLEQWLRENGYRLPRGAGAVLGSYLKQGMRFFVARVNLEEQSKLGYSYLRPLQMAYESPKFMLPIRLGMVNASGPQELYVYALTRTGRIETTNYRTVRVPSDVELPPYVKGEFGEFYRAMFAHAVEQQGGTAVFLEHAWDMGWCDPCAADPLSPQELRGLGVFWLDEEGASTFVTRLHVRYDAAHFPEDLVFQATNDRGNFQGRYILRQPWKGESRCPAVADYRRTLAERQEREARSLAELTDWELGTIRSRSGLSGSAPEDGGLCKWWQGLWGE